MKIQLFRNSALSAALALSCCFSHASKHDHQGAPVDKELAKYAGEYTGETRTKTESLAQSEMQEFSLKHHSMSMSLGADGSATVSQSPHGDDEVTNFGHFKASGGQVVVTFDPAPDGKGTPSPMTFSTGHNELTAVSYDHALWGKLPPPPMHRGGVDGRPSAASKRGSN